MTYTEQLRFWFEQVGLANAELVGLLLAALLFSPLPRLIVVFLALRIGFNGFPGKFVSFAFALALSLIQLEPTISPILAKASELGVSKGSITAEQRQNLLKLSESQWDLYIDGRILPQFKDKIESISANTSPESSIAQNSIGRKAASFLLSELDRAFRTALVIILPLLIIELLTGTALSALDLKIDTQLVSLPLKLALFLSTSGWSLITETLLKLN